jgi:hypothetical protein
MGRMHRAVAARIGLVVVALAINLAVRWDKPTGAEPARPCAAQTKLRAFGRKELSRSARFAPKPACLFAVRRLRPHTSLPGWSVRLTASRAPRAPTFFSIAVRVSARTQTWLCDRRTSHQPCRPLGQAHRGGTRAPLCAANQLNRQTR